MSGIGRRKFLASVAGISVTRWADTASAQPSARRVGVLLFRDRDDPMEQDRLASFGQSIASLGWIEGRNVQIDVRWSGESVERMRTSARELVALQPDAIFVLGGQPALALQRETQIIPIVFALAGDAVANGLVRNIARPERNTTGISNNIPSFGSKWLELLTAAAPGVMRFALIHNPAVTIGEAYFTSIQEAARQRGFSAVRTPVSNITELERAIEAFASEPAGGLVEIPPPLRSNERQLMYRLALKHRLPTIYSVRSADAEGGLISYGPDTKDQIRVAASYVDRILRGTKVSELPIQFPTKFELVVNQKTAKAMGLVIPEAFLLRADEVIE